MICGILFLLYMINKFQVLYLSFSISISLGDMDMVCAIALFSWNGVDIIDSVTVK